MPADAPPPSNLVLLVDNDLRTSRRLADMLREDGLTVEIARDGAFAVARFTREPIPDALVTELTTTHVDAASIGRFARAQRPGMPILVVTSHPSLFQPDTFGGAVPLLFTKPVEYSKLKEALVQALQPTAPSGPKSAPKIGVVTPESESKARSAASVAENDVSESQTVAAVQRP
jgi:DNA-binding NtrC family response regulator